MSQNWTHMYMDASCLEPSEQVSTSFTCPVLSVVSVESAVSVWLCCGSAGSKLWPSGPQTLRSPHAARLSPCTAFLTAALFFTFKPLHISDFFNLRVVPKSCVTLLPHLQKSACFQMAKLYPYWQHLQRELSYQKMDYYTPKARVKKWPTEWCLNSSCMVLM